MVGEREVGAGEPEDVACTACGNRSWTLHDRIAVLAGRRAAMFICTGCGFIRLHDLDAIGFVLPSGVQLGTDG